MQLPILKFVKKIFLENLQRKATNDQLHPLYTDRAKRNHYRG